MSTPKASKFISDTKIHMIEEENSPSKSQSIINIVNSFNKNDDIKQTLNNKRYSKESDYSFQNDQIIIKYKQNSKDTYLPFSSDNQPEKKYDYSTAEVDKYTKETKQSSNNNITTIDKKINIQDLDNDYSKVSEFKLVDQNKDTIEVSEINKITENVSLF